MLHIDPTGSADPIPFGARGGPFVVIRLQPTDNERSRFVVSTRDPDDDPVEEDVQTFGLPDKVVQTIHQYGLFKFSTGTQSRPGTPTASTRSRAGIFGLDAISRNLFGTSTSRGGSSGDVFGTAGSHSRSRSATSSDRTRTDSLFKSSNRSDSTGVTTPDEEGVNKSLGAPRPSPRRKLVKRSKSPGPSGASGSESESPVRRPDSRAGDVEKELPVLTRKDMDESEWDLTQRLELARRNSQNQHGVSSPVKREPAVEETIYEGPLRVCGPLLSC